MDLGATSSSSASSKLNATTLTIYWEALQRKYSKYLDDSVPFVMYRWVVLLVCFIFYAVRVLTIQGFHIISYALGIYFLNIFISFLTPQVDPNDFMMDPIDDDEDEAPSLPDKADDEFKPFVRKMPEFKFWYNSIRAVLLSIVCTLFPFLDVPVFWPILLIYWALLVFVTMRKQIRHMIKHKYVPLTVGKPTFQGQKNVIKT